MRAFIAIKIPDLIIKPIADLQKELQDVITGVRWVQPQNLHVTLLFLGETPWQDLDYLTRKLEDKLKNCKSFMVNFNGLGAFPLKGAARVIWAGIGQGLQGMEDLFKCIMESRPGNKFPDQELFSPHLTLGRVKDPTRIKDLPTILKKYNNFATQEFLVGSVHFFKSELTATGPFYTEIKTIKLAP